MLSLAITKRTDDRLLLLMDKHYSRPRGFVGRSICYAITYENVYYGHIVAGSATRFLPGRNEFLGIKIEQLNLVINNIFFHIEKGNEERYPTRNFVPFVIQNWCNLAAVDWLAKYGDEVIGFETLVELPRTGESYRRAGWKKVGTTKGYTCKRTAGKGSDTWSGKRVWDTKNLRPKFVFCLRNKPDLSMG